MNITRCANHSNSLVHLRRQWRPPSAKAHEPCVAEVGTQGASVPIATRAAEVYLICLFHLISVYKSLLRIYRFPVLPSKNPSTAANMPQLKYGATKKL